MITVIHNLKMFGGNMFIDKKNRKKYDTKFNIYRFIQWVLLIFFIAHFFYSSIKLFISWKDFFESGISISSEEGGIVFEQLLTSTIYSFLLCLMLFVLILLLQKIIDFWDRLQRKEKDDMEIHEAIRLTLRSLRKDVSENNDKIKNLEKNSERGEGEQ